MRYAQIEPTGNLGRHATFNVWTDKRVYPRIVSAQFPPYDMILIEAARRSRVDCLDVAITPKGYEITYCHHNKPIKNAKPGEQLWESTTGLIQATN